MVPVLDKRISGLALHFLVKGTTYVAEQQRTQTSFSAK